MKLTKEKRDQLILSSMGTLVVLIAIWYLLISPRYDAIKRINHDIGAQQNTLQDMQDAITRATAAADELRDATNALTEAESDLSSGDPNAWVFYLVRQLKEHYKMDISVGNQPAIDDVDLLPNFPYKQLRISVNGTAFYHDLGNFIAEFENNYPHARITSLSLEPSNGDSSEKLSFHMDLIALVKLNQPPS